MADKNFTMHRYNGTSFDTLYPETTIEQVDNLQTSLDSKVNKNNDITGDTKAKITYDSKGLVTGGADLVENDIPALHLTKVTDVTASATELNYVDGVTSAIQPQIDSKQSAIIYSDSQPASQEVGDWWYEDTTEDPALAVPLYFEALNGTASIALIKQGSPAWTGSYSTDGINWLEYIPGTTGQISMPTTGSRVYFKGTYSSAPDYSNRLKFYMAKKNDVKCCGNIMSLCSGDNFASAKIIPVDYAFNYLFEDAYYVRTAPLMPAEIITTRCYSGMFMNSGITTVAKLHATALATDCYYKMFDGCTSLQVSDTQTAEAPYAWAIPTSGTFTNTYTQTWMFSDCKGTRSTDSPTFTAGNSYTYYTQNEPV